MTLKNSGLAALVVLSLFNLGMDMKGCEGMEDDSSFDLEVERPFEGIVNGEETNYESFTGVIALYLSLGTSGAMCTGTLIDPRVILTAGHCVYGPGDGIDAITHPEDLMILGGPDLNDQPNIIYYPDVEAVVKHPEWGGQITFNSVDLAMVKLKDPLTTTEMYRVRESDDFDVGTTGKIVGYGLSSSADQNSSGIHRMGDTHVQNKLAHYINLGDPAGTCSGDSGGPFFTMVDGYWQVTGVTSLGLSGECDPYSGNVDVNVVMYRGWVDDTMNDFVGYGLADVPHEEDTDTDTDTDTDPDGGISADAGSGVSSPDDGCGCVLTGGSDHTTSVLTAIIG
jgi:secreted trypsin-like serine protease